MRAVRYQSHGGPEVLGLIEAPDPVPGDGQVLIAVDAIGANVIDTMFRRGDGPWPRPLPGPLTGDVVGKVVAVGGGGVDPELVGARVAAMSEDAFCDLVVADANWLVPVPAQADAGQATALAMTAPLALRLLRAGRVQPGEAVVVHAAAGGVGHLVVQLAKTLGAKVIGMGSGPVRLEFIRGLGADIALDSSDPHWSDQIRGLFPDGVDVVLEAIGGEVFKASMDMVSPLGRVVTYGAIGGTIPTIDVAALFQCNYVTGLSIGAWRAVEAEKAREDIDEVAALFSAGRLHSVVHSTVALGDAAKVHQIMEERANLGRIVVVP